MSYGLSTLDALKSGFNPDEPRRPAGNPDGGEWTDGSGTAPAPSVDRRPDNQQPRLIPVAAHRQAPDQYRTGDPNAFFDTLYTPVHALARRLAVDERWLFGLSAYESGWLNPHSRQLNDPFGVTYGGGPDVHYSSIDSAVAYWERRYGPVVQGARSAEEFARRLFATDYNQRNPNWSRDLLDVIRSVPRHLDPWQARHNP